MTVEDSAYVAVLNKKLVDAERALYEFKRIFDHWQSKLDNDHKTDSCQIPPTQRNTEGANEYIEAPVCDE